jgi:metal-sulfur cluster biosynthetic enzyme
VVEATVDLVWDPPWTPSMISEAARQKLGMG